MVLEILDVLVERRDVEVLPDLRAGVDEVVAEALQLLLVLRLRDRLRLAAAAGRDKSERGNDNNERRPAHSGRYATRALAGDA